VTFSVPVEAGPVRPLVDRALALLTSALVAGLVVVLARATPDPRGYGTHELLGMQPCAWPAVHGIPCPTCGVTTAACWLVHLSPGKALVTQPFGALTMALVIVIGVHALWSLVRRRSFLEPFVWLPYGRILLGGLAVLLLSWLWTYETFPGSRG